MNAWTSRGKLVEARSTGPLFEPAPRVEGAVDMHARSFRVEHHRTYNGWGLDWRLYTYGRGHWCEGTGHSGSFKTEAEARAAGHQWVVTGRDNSTRRP
jgi:hypothetical protein